mgnify:FL=1
MSHRVLVTGASGFIGRAILPLLSAFGCEIHAVCQTKSLAVPDVTWHRTDLLLTEQRRELLVQVRPTHIIHTAWITTPEIYWTSPLNELWKAATLDLLSLGEKVGAERFIGVGSCAEYDWSAGVMDEHTTPLTAATPYGQAKAACGMAVIHHAGAMSTAWGRLFHLYGPYEHPRRLVPSVIRSLLAGKRAQCTHGEQIRDFLHVSDVAASLAALMFSDYTGPVNIGSGKRVVIKQIITMIARELDREDLIDLGSIPAPRNDPPLLAPNVDRVTRSIGWKPAHSLEQGIQKTVEWWMQQEKK